MDSQRLASLVSEQILEQMARFNTLSIGRGSASSGRLHSAREDPDLAEAIKYGKKEAANPGRDGAHRLKYTHKGVV